MYSFDRSLYNLMVSNRNIKDATLEGDAYLRDLSTHCEIWGFMLAAGPSPDIPRAMEVIE